MKKDFNYNIYLEKNYHIEKDNYELKELNESILKNIDKKDKKEVADTLFKWVRDKIKYRISDIIGALGTYKRGNGACVDKSSLLITLLRINKIPARYLILRAIISIETPIKGNYVDHCVVQAFIDNKWIILDPTFDPYFNRIFKKSTFNSPNWWDISKSKIYGARKKFSKIELRIISESYKEPSEWKDFILEILNNGNN
ncbi:MAG: transglutaminase-like domain-containing protein [Candidatus Helarchaeota archaeon]